MIDMDRVRALRDARLMTIGLALVCASAIVWPWDLVKDLLFTIFAVFFVLRSLEYTERIREHQLAIDDLPVRDRRRNRME